MAGVIAFVHRLERRVTPTLNDVFGARVNGVMVDSDDVITAARLDAMAASGAAFSELIWAASEAAS